MSDKIAPDTPLTVEELAGALAGFSVGLMTALMTKGPQTADQALESLANELVEIASRQPKTLAAESLALTAHILIAGEATGD